jgi:hypothetical protein
MLFLNQHGLPDRGTRLKYEIIDKIENGMKPCDVCKLHELAPSTVATFLKKKEEIKKEFQSNRRSTAVRTKTTKHAQLEAKLFEWFVHARQQNVSMNGPILMEKANVLAASLGNHDFNAKSGWLQRFKDRYNITLKKVVGEESTVSPVVESVWRNETLRLLIKNYEPQNIFNADESGLFYQAQPDRTFSLKGKNFTCFLDEFLLWFEKNPF